MPVNKNLRTFAPTFITLLKNKKMKKVLFSFAILAVAATMTSCDNKGTKNADAKDSAAVAEAAPAEAADPNTLSTDAFSMKAPEGYEIDGKVEYLQQNHKVSFRSVSGSGINSKIDICHDANIKFETRKADIAKLKAIDPIKVGNVEFQGGWQPDGKSVVLYADLADKGTARVFFPKPSGPKAKDLDDAAIIAQLTELLSGLNFK